MEFNLLDYMLNVATKLKAIGHTEEKQAYARIKGVADLEEFLNLRNASDTCLLPIDSFSGRISDPSNDPDNLLDKMFNHFYIVMRVKLEDHDDKQAKLKACKLILYKIMAKMKTDRFEHRMSDGEMAELIMGSYTYDSIGPIGDNYYGLSVSFELINNLFEALTHNPDDWDE